MLKNAREALAPAPSAGALPSLTEGKSTSPQLAVHGQAKPVNLLWDVALPLVVAIALPLLLKYLLESGILRLKWRPRIERAAPADSYDEFDEI